MLFRSGIDKGVFSLGDRQAQRYKIRDDVVSRIVQYYLCPVIEVAVGRRLRPTYTYLSAYVEGADLPPHTDNPDCQFTVSFVVNKTPADLYYPIYVDKTRQEVKYRGRYDRCPDKAGAIEIDCPVNDAMIFSGIDHIHWRERLNGQYTTLLLHYIVRPELSP